MLQEQDVLDLVQRWAKVELTGDVEAYGSLLVEDFVGVGPVGFVLTKEQWAQRHHGDVTNHAFEVLEPHVRIYGDTALVEAVQRQRTTARGHDTSGSFRLLVACVQAGGNLAIAHLQLSGPLMAPDQLPAFAR